MNLNVGTEMFVETGLDIAAQGDFRLEIMVEFAKGFYGEVLDEVYQ